MHVSSVIARSHIKYGGALYSALVLIWKSGCVSRVNNKAKKQFCLRRQAGVSGNNGGPLFGGRGWVLAPSQYIKARPKAVLFMLVILLCWLLCAAKLYSCPHTNRHQALEGQHLGPRHALSRPILPIVKCRRAVVGLPLVLWGCRTTYKTCTRPTVSCRAGFVLPTPFAGARIWGRVSCKDAPTDPACASYNCTSASGPVPIGCALGPTKGKGTLFEIHLGKTGTALDFYDISLVDAYNLPINIVPVPGSYAGARAP